jgi:branched-chain amino acid aminotransferase
MVQQAPRPSHEVKAAPPSATPTYIWVDGALLPWDQPRVHITEVGWPAISAIFEGIRAYWNAAEERLYVWVLEQHLQRFLRSMKLMRMQAPYTLDELKRAIIELLAANGFRDDVYIQPVAYVSSARGSRYQADQRPTIYITTRIEPSALTRERGATACISSWTRISDNVMPPRIKAMANYHNSRLASAEATRNGYDSPIFLNTRGTVAEGPGSCFFMVRDGALVTPPITASILESVTRAVILRLGAEVLGVPAIEREIDRTELYTCDEAFFCGTAAEINPVVAIDGYQVGEGTMGPLTRALDRLFHDIARGIDHRYPEWRTPVA